MQAIAEVETRVAVVECSLNDIQNDGPWEKGEVLTESVDALQRLHFAQHKININLSVTT